MERGLEADIYTDEILNDIRGFQMNVPKRGYCICTIHRALISFLFTADMLIQSILTKEVGHLNRN